MAIALITVGYTLVVVGFGLVPRWKARGDSAGEFLDGGRRFGFWQVFTLVTAMWASWMLPVELETAFAQGISAVWFGASVIAMSLVAAVFLLAPFRRLGFLTNSNLIGRRFGATARGFAAVIIGLTFPIFAMGNLLAVAALLHGLLGWPVWITLAGATLTMLLYTSAGGLWSLAYTQAANLVVMTVGLGLATVYVLRDVPVLHPAHLPVTGFLSWGGVGTGAILVWFAMNILNTFTAQAEFQAIAAVRDPVIGRRAVYLSSVVLVGFAAVPVLLGMAAREYDGAAANGLVAFPTLVSHVVPGWALALVLLGFWASALTWCAPLLFSGASSFGLDFWNRGGDPARTTEVRRWTRWSLVLQGILLVAYALVRPDALSWWQVFGLTIRNAVVVAPTIVFLVWPAVRGRAVVAAMILGLVGGLGWNAATGFSPTVFLSDINPMWVGTGIAFLAMLVGTLAFSRGRLTLSSHRVRRAASVALAVLGLVLVGGSAALPRVHLVVLLGPGLFVGVLAWFVAAVLTVERTSESIDEIRASSALAREERVEVR